jgi:hypothetical protein
MKKHSNPVRFAKKVAPFIVGMTVASLFVACVRKGDDVAMIKTNGKASAHAGEKALREFGVKPDEANNLALASKFLAATLRRTTNEADASKITANIEILLKGATDDEKPIDIVAAGDISSKAVGDLKINELSNIDYKVSAKCVIDKCAEIQVLLTQTVSQDVKVATDTAPATTPADPSASAKVQTDAKKLERKLVLVFRLPSRVPTADETAKHIDTIDYTSKVMTLTFSSPSDLKLNSGPLTTVDDYNLAAIKAAKARADKDKTPQQLADEKAAADKAAADKAVADKAAADKTAADKAAADKAKTPKQLADDKAAADKAAADKLAADKLDEANAAAAQAAAAKGAAESKAAADAKAVDLTAAKK